MIAYIKGPITYKAPTSIVVEAGNIGYRIQISLHTYAQIEKLENVKIFTYLHIKEDSHTLYGFAEERERTLFTQLIAVTGIGPTTAQILLSSMSPDEARAAIIGEDLAAFKRVKGIGPKTAKQIILDLKDKLLRDSGEEDAIALAPQSTGAREEALSALIALGFNKIQVQKVLNQLLRERREDWTVERLIKEALKNLAS